MNDNQELDEIILKIFNKALQEVDMPGMPKKLAFPIYGDKSRLFAEQQIQAYVARQCREIKISRAAKIAMAVAKSQLKRGENPTKNITATLLLELENIAALQQKGER